MLINARRYDLDWLRVLAFLVLVYFHTAIFFIPGGLPLIQNAEVSGGLELFVDISSQFRLSLLFFISGVGVAFARRRRSNREFIVERSTRLLIPLVVGLLFIVPPMVYTEKLFMVDFAGSFIEFYPNFFTQGVYPKGNLSWHHFWFIVYLYLFCLMGLKVFTLMENRGKRLLQIYVKRMQGPGIYSFIIPLLIAELPLRIFFPGFRDLIHDWASFAHWFLIFLAGFTIAKNESLLNTATHLRHISLVIAITCTLILYALYGTLSPKFNPADEWIILKYVVFCILRMGMVWACILTCLGYAGKHLQFSSPLLSYVTEAVYPLFILHLSIITIVGYHVVGLGWSLASKYLFISTTTIALIAVIYHFLIRPFNSMRLLFGVKAKTSPKGPFGHLPAL